MGILRKSASTNSGGVLLNLQMKDNVVVNVRNLYFVGFILVLKCTVLNVLFAPILHCNLINRDRKGTRGSSYGLNLFIPANSSYCISFSAALKDHKTPFFFFFLRRKARISTAH